MRKIIYSVPSVIIFVFSLAFTASAQTGIPKGGWLITNTTSLNSLVLTGKERPTNLAKSDIYVRLWSSNAVETTSINYGSYNTTTNGVLDVYGVLNVWRVEFPTIKYSSTITMPNGLKITNSLNNTFHWAIDPATSTIRFRPVRRLEGGVDTSNDGWVNDRVYPLHSELIKGQCVYRLCPTGTDARISIDAELYRKVGTNSVFLGWKRNVAWADPGYTLLVVSDGVHTAQGEVDFGSNLSTKDRNVPVMWFTAEQARTPINGNLKHFSLFVDDVSTVTKP